MRKPARIELCPVCKDDGGIHYSDDLVPVATRPHHDQAKQVAEAHALSAAANEAAMQAGRLIIRDFATTHHTFSGNHIRHLFDAAMIPEPCVGAIFRWAASDGATADGPLIVNTGRREQSSEASTRHQISIWASRVFVERGVA